MSESKTKQPSSTDLGFSDAMSELEEILERIEGEAVDIDRLAEELGRAAVLLETCRGKIRRAEVEVTQIVQSLEDSETLQDSETGSAEIESVETDDEDDDIPF